MRLRVNAKPEKGTLSLQARNKNASEYKYIQVIYQFINISGVFLLFYVYSLKQPNDFISP